MGQFDSETNAALTQLNWEEISKTPGGEFAEIIGDFSCSLAQAEFRPLQAEFPTCF